MITASWWLCRKLIHCSFPDCDRSYSLSSVVTEPSNLCGSVLDSHLFSSIHFFICLFVVWFWRPNPRAGYALQLLMEDPKAFLSQREYTIYNLSNEFWVLLRASSQKDMPRKSPEDGIQEASKSDVNHLRWLLLIWRSSGTTPSSLMMELITLSLRLSPTGDTHLSCFIL